MSYKENARAVLLKNTHARDLCDDREVVFCATAAALPNGESGIVLLSLKGHELFISDIDWQSNIGQTLYTVPLPDAEQFKISWALIGSKMRFSYRNARYAFTNLVGIKDMLAVLKAEAAGTVGKGE